MSEAEQLFIERGFDQTTVKEIADKAGVAKGTFYYYFNTKEELISAILQRRYEEAEKDAKKIAEDERLDPISKLELIISRLIFAKKGNLNISEYFQIDKNANVMKKRNVEFRNKFIPIFKQVVKEGIEKKIFQTSYPSEITEILLIGIDGFLHIHQKDLLSSSYINQKMDAVEKLICQVLELDQCQINLKTKQNDE